jgi:hypothetical protein
MTPCDRLRADAPGLAALAEGDPERAEASAHARGCPGCARALAEAEALQRLLTEAAPEPLPASTLARASRAIREELRREVRRRAGLGAAAAAGSALALVALARSRSPVPLDLALALALALAAAGLAAAARRRPAAALAGAVLAALAGLAAAGPGPLAPSLGLECLASELGAAAVVVVAGWLALRGGTTAPARLAVAAAAAAGALAGDAALQLTCAAHAAVPHLLAFHVGGVVLAAAGASLAWPRPAPAPSA